MQNLEEIYRLQLNVTAEQKEAVRNEIASGLIDNPDFLKSLLDDHDTLVKQMRQLLEMLDGAVTWCDTYQGNEKQLSDLRWLGHRNKLALGAESIHCLLASIDGPDCED